MHIAQEQRLLGSSGSDRLECFGVGSGVESHPVNGACVSLFLQELVHRASFNDCCFPWSFLRIFLQEIKEKKWIWRDLMAVSLGSMDPQEVGSVLVTLYLMTFSNRAAISSFAL